MNKARQNFIIDTIGFICFILLVSTGVIMYYLLPAGSGHSLGIWGLSRHEWGAVHFWVAVGFLGVMGLHLLWHWSWIFNLTVGRKKEQVNRRAILSVVAVLALLAIGFAPVFSPVNAIGPVLEHTDHPGDRVRGSMSLNQVHRETGVPVEYLLRELALPAEVDRNQPLRELKDQYGFEVEEVREVVLKYK